MSHSTHISKRTQGISLIETIVTITLLGIVLGAIAPIFTNYAQINRKSQYRTEAISAAQQVTDGLRQKSFTDWPTTGSSLPVTVSGSVYQVKVSYCTGTLEALCANGANHTRVEVSRYGTVYYSVETVYTKFE